MHSLVEKILVAFVCWFALPNLYGQPDLGPPLEVHFIDVGTGDCIWIHTGDDGIPGNGKFEGYNIIIDGGDWGRTDRIDGYKFAKKYLQTGDDPLLSAGTRIDWLILTHPHSDHSGGLVGFLEDYDVAFILDAGHDKTTSNRKPDRLRPSTAYGRFFKAAEEELLSTGERANYLWGVPSNLELDWGDELDVQVLGSSREIIGGDLNNVSIVLRLGFTADRSDASFLFTGDAEKFVEKKLVDSLGDELRTKVLKAGHHGSNSSTTVEFLREVQPQHVVISSGNHSFSGTMLPSQRTLERIAQVSKELDLGTKVWRTDRDDKDPLKKVGKEGGDDTVVFKTSGQGIEAAYVNE